MSKTLLAPLTIGPIDSANPAARLAALLSDPKLTDLVLNGAQESWADFGGGLRRVADPCGSSAELEHLARWLLEQADRHIDFANPFADCVLTSAELGISGNDKFRIHAVLASASSQLTLLSVRKHSNLAIGLHEFVGGRLELELWLRGVLARRENFLISGATGAGKTTLLRALLTQVALGYSPSELAAIDNGWIQRNLSPERIIAIEEVAELGPLPGHFVSLQTRQPNTEGRGGITLDDLMRQVLRMRPDRLVLGEVRGLELLTLVTALNTGHRGAAGSIHANNAQAVATRITTIGLQANLLLPAVSAAVAEAVQWVIHVERRGEVRRITQVSRLEVGQQGELCAMPVEALQGFL